MDPGTPERFSEAAPSEGFALNGQWILYRHMQVLEGEQGPWICAPMHDQVLGHHRALGRYFLPLAGPDKEAWESVTGLEIEREVRSEGTQELPYSPLKDEDGLFLWFARLADEGEITPEVWIDWIDEYGVLGLQPESPTSLWGDPRGGPEETFAAFKALAMQANLVLKTYEAATAPQGPDEEALKALLPRRKPITFKGEKIETKDRTVGELRDEALEEVRETVQSWINLYCHPQVFLIRGVDRRGWGFKNLLGAMYLQMFWLLTEPGQVRRCQASGCNKVLIIEQPEEAPGYATGTHRQYKTRTDKQHCNHACVMRRIRRDNRPTEGPGRSNRSSGRRGTGPRARRGGRPPLIPIEKRPELHKQLGANPKATLEEQREMWRQRHGVDVSAPTMSRMIKALSWRREKGRWVLRD